MGLEQVSKNNHIAGEDDDEAGLDEELEAVEDAATSVPLHVLFYGKNHNRLDSYSIMNLKGQQQSHVYVTVREQ